MPNLTSPGSPRDDSTSQARSRPSRGDHWSLVAFVWLVVAVTVAVTVVVPMVGWIRGSSIETQLTTDAKISALDAAHLSYSDANVDVTIDHPTVGQRALGAAPGLLTAALAIGLTVLLMPVLNGIAAGNPFTSDNTRRLRWLGYGIAVGATVVAFATQAFNGALAGSLDLNLDRVVVSFALPVLPLIVGLVIVTLAFAFERGRQLDADLQGVV